MALPVTLIYTITSESVGSLRLLESSRSFFCLIHPLLTRLLPVLLTQRLFWACREKATTCSLDLSSVVFFLLSLRVLGLFSCVCVCVVVLQTVHPPPFCAFLFLKNSWRVRSGGPRPAAGTNEPGPRRGGSWVSNWVAGCVSIVSLERCIVLSEVGVCECVCVLPF